MREGIVASLVEVHALLHPTAKDRVVEDNANAAVRMHVVSLRSRLQLRRLRALDVVSRRAEVAD